MSYEQDASEATSRAEVLESIPAHMQHRLLSTLIQSEWSVPIKLEHELDAPGGIALVRKVMVPQVLRSVGSTFRATAMLTSQPAWELGMRGYDSAAVTCTIQYVDETGQARLKETRKWLTQLGIEATVSMATSGLKMISQVITMHKVVIKFDATAGWRQLRALHVADYLRRVIPEEAFSSVLVRDGTMSATVLIHARHLPPLLRTSGQGSIFNKLHADDPKS